MRKEFVFNDGGRAAAGFKGSAGDCVTRSIAIASGLPYAEVYKHLAAQTGTQRVTKGRKPKGATARNGINTGRKWFKDYMASIGAKWTPTMSIGSGCKVHLDAKELPAGRLVVAVSKHYTAVIDGVIQDTFDPRRGQGSEAAHLPAGEVPSGSGWRKVEDGYFVRTTPERCVYGYWTFPA